jgi:hypothetical protein
MEISMLKHALFIHLSDRSDSTPQLRYSIPESIKDIGATTFLLDIKPSFLNLSCGYSPHIFYLSTARNHIGG